MKKFEVPTLEVVRFNQKDILTTSSCWCDACTVCPEGKNDCMCFDFSGRYDPTNEA